MVEEWLFGDSQEKKQTKEEEKIGKSNIYLSNAYPIKDGREREQKFLLIPDIITPHYKDVGTEFDVQPVPIPFLVVSPQTTFKFLIGINKERLEKISKEHKDRSPQKYINDFNYLTFLDNAIIYAMALGVGAKTSLGYSTFELISYNKI